jgi:hypothetical protein
MVTRDHDEGSLLDALKALAANTQGEGVPNATARLHLRPPPGRSQCPEPQERSLRVGAFAHPLSAHGASPTGRGASGDVRCRVSLSVRGAGAE